ncbi:hypothetical protein E2C01_045463 [Portunus trituberculatus]|uniref:Uncharacterized protein n=1 Tax=Portunus trituberculatus TaxID=210409 RepID=A0A5B7G550_PORTR|nr:hypothetical protein [Portunus trituberculatus]
MGLRELGRVGSPPELPDAAQGSLMPKPGHDLAFLSTTVTCGISVLKRRCSCSREGRGVAAEGRRRAAGVGILL